MKSATWTRCGRLWVPSIVLGKCQYNCRQELKQQKQMEGLKQRNILRKSSETLKAGSPIQSPELSCSSIDITNVIDGTTESLTPNVRAERQMEQYRDNVTNTTFSAFDLNREISQRREVASPKPVVKSRPASAQQRRRQELIYSSARPGPRYYSRFEPPPPEHMALTMEEKTSRRADPVRLYRDYQRTWDKDAFKYTMKQRPYCVPRCPDWRSIVPYKK